MKSSRLRRIGLIAGLGLSPWLCAQPFYQVGSAVSSLTNVNHGAHQPFQFDDSALHFAGLAATDWVTEADNRISLDVELETSHYRHWDKYDHQVLSARAGWSKKLGLGWDKPVFGVSSQLKLSDYRSAYRDQLSLDTAVFWQKPVTESISFDTSLGYYLSRSHNVSRELPANFTHGHHAKNNQQIFDNARWHFDLGSEWNYSETQSLALGLSYQDGDFNGSSPWFDDHAPWWSAYQADDAIANYFIVAYQAKVYQTRLNWFYAFSQQVSIHASFSHDQVKTESRQEDYQASQFKLGISYGF